MSREDRSMWDKEEDWRKYGIEHGYNNMDYSSLAHSKDKDERAWINKGLASKDGRLKRFTLNRKRLEAGLWEDLDFTVAEARRVMEVEGWEELPSQGRLREKDYFSLTHAIFNYHGGIRKFREILGQKNKRKENNSWKDLDYTIAEARRIMEKEGWEELPSQRELWQKGYSSLTVSLAKYHGGLYKFKELLGQKQKKRESGTWQDIDYAIDAARKAMGEEGWEELPGHKKLVKKYSSLGGAIQKYHGGYIAFRETLRERMGAESTDSKLEKMLDEYLGESKNE